jgi:hypothetical protein
MAVLARSRHEGTHRFLLVVIALHADPSGEWQADQTTLQGATRLSRRQVQRLLSDLVASGELSLASRRGRGKLSTFQIRVGENASPATHFPGQKCAVHDAFPAPKCAAHDAFSVQKCAAHDAFSAPLDSPFPPDPQIPLYPPEKQIQETSGLRPLPGPRSAVFRVKLLLEEAGVPLPSPAQIGLWSKTLGGIEPLLELLRGLIQAGLANKREPMRYVHRVVMERAAHPEPSSPLPLRGGGARGGGASKTRNPVLLAGSDETRRQLALEIIAKQGGKK